MPKRGVRVAAAAAVALTVAGGLIAADQIYPLPAEAEQGNGNCPVTAADTFGWGTPNRFDYFESPDSLGGWHVYDGAGHNGNGLRTPNAISVADGVLTITGDAQGNSGGMAWMPGQLHGRWEVCARSLPSAETYHSVALLWPDAENWPEGGEIDFMEVTDPTRQSVDGFLHYGPHNNLEQGDVAIDATQWHSWAVEWTPDSLVYFIDGRPWWETRNADHLPPGPMHLCLQLDNFGGDTSQGGQTMVDWVRQYSL